MGRPKKQVKGAVAEGKGPTPTESYKELLKPPYLDQVESHFKGVSENIPGGKQVQKLGTFQKCFLNKQVSKIWVSFQFTFVERDYHARLDDQTLCQTALSNNYTRCINQQYVFKHRNEPQLHALIPSPPYRHTSCFFANSRQIFMYLSLYDAKFMQFLLIANASIC